jgi:hypothetical protein
VHEEKGELDSKISRLDTFIRCDEKFVGLPLVEQRLMINQLFVMRCYSDILDERIRERA